MEIQEATELIRFEGISAPGRQRWCDFGCGTGTFTKALAELLPPGSLIYAIDAKLRAARRVPEQYGGTTIFRIVADISKNGFRPLKLDGALFANSLHFIQDQKSILQMVRDVAACVLIVEYDNKSPSAWVPYPLDFEKLRQLFLGVGYKTVVR